MLGVCGGAAGLLLAWLGVAGLRAAAPPGIPRVDAIQIDAAALAITALATLFSVFVFAAAPSRREGTVLARLSGDWRDRLLKALIEFVPVSDHPVKLGRQTMHLRELTYAQLQEVGARTLVPDVVKPDLDLLITVGRFWGPDAVKRLRFVDAPDQPRTSKVESLLDKFLS